MTKNDPHNTPDSKKGKTDASEEILAELNKYTKSIDPFMQWRISELTKDRSALREFLDYREALQSLAIEAYTIFSTLARNYPELATMLPKSTARALIRGTFNDLTAREIFALVIVINDSSPAIPEGRGYTRNYVIRQFVDLSCLLAGGPNAKR